MTAAVAVGGGLGDEGLEVVTTGETDGGRDVVWGKVLTALGAEVITLGLVLVFMTVLEDISDVNEPEPEAFGRVAVLFAAPADPAGAFLLAG